MRGACALLMLRYTTNMSTQPTDKAAVLQESIDNLATMVAQGFAAVDERFDKIDERFEKVDQRFDKIELDIESLRSEIRSIRAELLRMPDDIDATYAKTFNDLLERVSTIEKKLGIVV